MNVNLRHHTLSVLLLATASIFALPASAADYVRVDDAAGVDLYYEEAGHGRPVVIVPGWTMTTRFFRHQLDAFEGSQDIRLIVLDPRAHGRSTKTVEGAWYGQHARDLAAFIEALELRRPVVAGWSWGAITVYDYLQEFGADAVAGAVFIDNPPKPLTESEPSGWTDGDRGVVEWFFDAVAEDQLAAEREFIPSMFLRDLSEEELDWMLAETLLTPKVVASQLLYDGWMADHRETLAGLEIPVLQVVRADNADVARAWLEANHPASELAAFGAHAMFYEFPERFNEALRDFVTGLE